MLELVQIDLLDGDPLGKSAAKAHLQRAPEAPEEDPHVFCERMLALGLSDALLP
jgi:hypothetical protein